PTAPHLVGLGGLEPPTPRLSSVCSNQLSYRPPADRSQLWALKLKDAPDSQWLSAVSFRQPIGCGNKRKEWVLRFQLLRAEQRQDLRSRKEVIQPHLPVRLPCYDFTPVADPTFDGSLLACGPAASGVTDFRGVTGGVYKARERIHRGVADPRLLATPTSRGRV